MICERKLKLALSSSNHFSAHSLRFAPASADVEKVPLSVQLSQVRVLDVETETVTTEDVLVLGTDGLWDVVSSQNGMTGCQFFQKDGVVILKHCDDAGE